MLCPSWKINDASRIKVNFLNFNTLCSRLVRHSRQWKNTVLSLLTWNDTVLGCSYVTVHCTVILQGKNLGYIYENPSYNKNTAFGCWSPLSRDTSKTKNWLLQPLTSYYVERILYFFSQEKPSLNQYKSVLTSKCLDWT